MARRKKKGIAKRLTVTVILLCVAASAAYYLYRYLFRTGFVHYDEFGIDMPVNYSVHGIDVSRHQQQISWAGVKGMAISDIRLNFAFIKATEGVQNVDGQFRRNWRQAAENGISKGAYHFFIASKSGRQQALHFIRNVPLGVGDLPPVLDVEQTFGVPLKDLQQRVSDFLQVVEKRYGVRPIIYTNVDFYKNYLAGKFDEYPLWVAHYLVKDKPRINRGWLFWQHSESGRVDGIDAYVDFNVFNGDSLDLEAIKIKQTY